MPTYLELYDLRFSDEMKKRIAVAIAIAAQNILAEDGQTTNHANRVIWAKEALRDAQLMTEKIMWQILANPTVATKGLSSNDDELQFTVNSLIDTVAPVTEVTP